VLNYRATLLEVGIYTLAFRVTNTIRVFVVHSVQLAVAPTIFKLMDHPNNKQLYSRMMTYFSLLVVFTSLFFSLFGFEIIDLFTTDEIYISAHKLIPLLSIGILFGTLKDTAVNGLNIAKKTMIISIIVPAVAVFHLAFSYTLIPIIGVSGAAVSSSFSQLLVFLGVLFFAQKYYPIPYEYGRVAIPLAVAALLYIAGYQTNDFEPWARYAIKTLLIITFPFLLWLLGFLKDDEKQWVVGWKNKWLNAERWNK
jgi:O-antigen/teichoic acid export membrane protein